jgi:hypothetical protein
VFVLIIDTSIVSGVAVSYPIVMSAGNVELSGLTLDPSATVIVDPLSAVIVVDGLRDLPGYKVASAMQSPFI